MFRKQKLELLGRDDYYGDEPLPVLLPMRLENYCHYEGQSEHSCLIQACFMRFLLSDFCDDDFFMLRS